MCDLGAGLEELYIEALCQLSAPVRHHCPLVLHITLVAHQDDLCIVPRVVLDLCDPMNQKSSLLYT